MKRYQIWSASGVDMGIFEAGTARDALEMQARDAGYKSLADAEKALREVDPTRPVQPPTVEEVE